MARSASRRLSALLALVAGSALLVGCGTSEPPQPFPPRPADIDVMALDLCSTLTPEQRQQRGLEAGEPHELALSSGPSRACSWGNRTDLISYSVQTIDSPASDAIGTPKSSLDSVRSYGAVRVTDRENSSPICELYIDASDSRALRVQVHSIGFTDAGGPRAVDEVCRMTSTTASDIIANVRAGDD